MAEHKISTPSSSTGIVRFYDVQSSSIQLEPKAVMIAVAVFIVFELAVQIFF